MSETVERFTPGPWRFELNERNKTINLCGGKAKYDLTVMKFSRYGMQNGQPFFLDNREVLQPSLRYSIPAKNREHHREWFKLIDHPDANLIAAAPELYKALKNCVRYFEQNRNGGFNGEGRTPELDSAYDLAVKAVQLAINPHGIEYLPVKTLTDMKQGDTILVTGRAFVKELLTVERIKVSEHDGTEIIYDLKNNQYFNLGMYLSGESWVKEVFVLRYKPI